MALLNPLQEAVKRYLIDNGWETPPSSMGLKENTFIKRNIYSIKKATITDNVADVSFFNGNNSIAKSIGAEILQESNALLEYFIKN